MNTQSEPEHNFAEFLRSRRLEMNLSVRELGRRSGVTYTTIGQIEQGQ